MQHFPYNNDNIFKAVITFNVQKIVNAVKVFVANDQPGLKAQLSFPTSNLNIYKKKSMYRFTRIDMLYMYLNHGRYFFANDSTVHILCHVACQEV